ncbi:unnamed protein product, partial [marine sediment metagenome]
GGGGGGRISIWYTTDFASSTLQIQAYGGTSPTETRTGGAGTLFIKKSGANGDLIADNNNHNGVYTSQVSNTSWTLDNILIKNKAKYLIPENSTTTITTLNNCTSNSSLTNSGVLSTPNDFTISNLHLNQNGLLPDLLNLTVDSGVTFEVQNNFPDRNIFDESVGTGNGSTQDFKLAHYNKPNSQIIRVSGKEMTESTDDCSSGDYTINDSTGAIHFCTPPANGAPILASYIPLAHLTLNNLTLQNGAVFTHKQNTNTQRYTLNLEINNALSIDASSTINVS